MVFVSRTGIAAAMLGIIEGELKKNGVKNIFLEVAKDNHPARQLYSSNGYVEDKDKIFEDIIDKKPDVVMVALGVPQQEKLIYKYLDKFDKGIFIGVGGSFDVISGMKKRAPKIFIKLKENNLVNKCFDRIQYKNPDTIEKISNMKRLAISYVEEKCK